MRRNWGKLAGIGVGGIAVAAAIGVGASMALASTTTPVAHRAIAESGEPSISIITGTTTPPPTTTTTPPPTTERPAAVAPVNTLAKAPKTPKTTVPVPATTQSPLPVVPECQAGCQIIYRLYLSGNAHLDLMQTDDKSPTGMGVMAYWVRDRLVDHRYLMTYTSRVDDWPIDGKCDGDQCVVSFNTGTGLAGAILVNLDPATGIAELGSVLNDTGSIVLSDLNGDGTIDVSSLVQDGSRDGAPGLFYWATELNEDGHFVQTGCSPPLTDVNTPPPTAPLTGACPDA